MTIDRRTFLVGGCAAATGGALVSLSAIAAVGQVAGAEQPAAATPMAAAAGGQPGFELRIVGWDREDGVNGPRAPSSLDGASWIAIDQQWRATWH